MEKIVKQIQLLTLIIILISTVIAIGSELYQMFKIQRVTLADLLLLFLYLEVLAMVRVFWESQSIQITLPLFIAITALSRFIILQGKSINPEILVYEAGAILLIALAINISESKYDVKIKLLLNILAPVIIADLIFIYFKLLRLSSCACNVKDSIISSNASPSKNSFNLWSVKFIL